VAVRRQNTKHKHPIRRQLKGRASRYVKKGTGILHVRKGGYSAKQNKKAQFRQKKKPLLPTLNISQWLVSLSTPGQPSAPPECPPRRSIAVNNPPIVTLYCLDSRLSHPPWPAPELQEKTRAHDGNTTCSHRCTGRHWVEVEPEGQKETHREWYADNVVHTRPPEVELDSSEDGAGEVE